MTSTNQPVFAIVLQGNHKEQLKAWKFTYVASYEAQYELTILLIKSEPLNNLQRRKSMRNIETELKKLFGLEPLSMIYFKGGADVSKVHEFLNIQMN